MTDDDKRKGMQAAGFNFVMPMDKLGELVPQGDEENSAEIFNRMSQQFADQMREAGRDETHITHLMQSFQKIPANLRQKLSDQAVAQSNFAVAITTAQQADDHKRIRQLVDTHVEQLFGQKKDHDPSRCA